MWWVREYLGRNTHGRPNLITITKIRNIEFIGVKWINFASYHIWTRKIDDCYFHDFEIWVDAYGQIELG